MSERDGGPAFPAPSEDDDRTGEPYVVGFPGLSMRDWFAGQALAGALANFASRLTYEEVARRAYLIADEMLKEQSK